MCLYDRTGTSGFYSALEDSCGSEGLNMIAVILGGDGSLRFEDVCWYKWVREVDDIKTSEVP